MITNIFEKEMNIPVISGQAKKIPIIHENDDDDTFEPLRTQKIVFNGEDDENINYDDEDDNFEDMLDNNEKNSNKDHDENDDLSTNNEDKKLVDDDPSQDPYRTTVMTNHSLNSAVENLKTTLKNKTEPDEEIDVQFMNNLLKEFKLRKEREELEEMKNEDGIEIEEEELMSKMKGTHMSAADINKYVNQTGF